MTLFMAVTIMAILLFISFAVVNIAVKSTLFSSSGRDSQFAFYAADAGIECALYWDTKNDISKFDPTVPGSSINCAGSTLTAGSTIIGTTTQTVIGGAGSGSWTYCSNEWGTCSFSGTKQVRYGANGSYFYQTATNSISCNNATFGDPIVGTEKYCHYSSGGTGQSAFGFTMTPGQTSAPCAIVTVTKVGNSTFIKSRGYNTCETGGPRRVERGVEVNY